MRAALCFSGRATKDSRFTIDNLQKFFITPLKELGYEVDIFAHLWKIDDWERALDLLEPTEYEVEEDKSEELKELWETHLFEKYKDQIAEICPNVARGKMFWYPYTPNMFYSIQKANSLKGYYDRHQRYDLVARMRTDNICQEGSYKDELAKVVGCPSNTLWVPTDYCGSGVLPSPKMNYVVDNFAIGGSDALDAYAATYDHLGEYFDEAFRVYKPSNFPKTKLKGAYWLCGNMLGMTLKTYQTTVRPELAEGFTVLRKTAARAEVGHRRKTPINPVMKDWLKFRGIV
jgi:hypothetical protein